MKKQILLGLIFLITINSFAQDKASLTKEETINYLNKKVQECEGHFRTPDGMKEAMYYRDLSFKLEGDKVVLEIFSSNFSEYKNYYSYFERVTYQYFNPAHIISITESTTNKNEPIGIIVIKFSSNSCLSKQKVSWFKYRDEWDDSGKGFGNHDGIKTYSKNEVGFIYLSTDSSNFNKIKKALEYLRDLYKAEDDPFGE